MVENVYNLRHNFIQLCYDVRDAKYELIERLKEKQKNIDIINEELPEEFRKNGPPIPKYDPDEFPEEKLQVVVELPETETEYEVEEFSAKKILSFKPSGNELEKILLAKKTYPRFKDGFFHSDISNEEVLKVAQLTFEELCSYPEEQDTPYESSLRAIRMNRILYHQKLIIAEMQEMIDKFNNWIFEARKQRLPILIRGNFIDIFIVGLNEELQILKSCEEQEDKLSQIVNIKLSAVHDMEDTVDSLKNEKANQEIKLENLKIEQNTVTEQFKMAAENTKFYDFLKKVFKKKFKPPKIKADDETSSSESSSSEDDDYDDDEGSIDSRDFGFIKQDLNVCPKGCDPTIFNLVTSMRSKRHEIEQADREEVRLLEFTKKEIEVNTRKLGMLHKAYDDAQEQLESFRRDKQKNLNNVRCTVILNLDQIYGFEQYKPEEMKISDFLVFSRSKLSDLYKRVGKLQNDALEEQGKHE
ncbi:unnamed protein product [Ceutorhynchus assimilis]|uniref:Uncharacterized protein n=1 Tax=Ceutorhynchus assimilis TaxID=467358 RepID=A0A9N9QKU2_9CUCU|nr:unnamed protein product [Ceutorhynchus assimilis]